MLNEIFDLPEWLVQLDSELMRQCAGRFAEIDQIKEHNQLKVLKAFINHRVGAHHLAGSTGYGYGDIGRDLLDKVFADAVGAEDALCRAQFVSGTHAIAVALFGLLRTGDVLLSATGRPYDTLREVIGWGGTGGNGSLKDFGMGYLEAELKDGGPDIERIAGLAPRAQVVLIQRSRGYAARRALSCSDIGAIAAAVRTANPSAVIVVDNCYGEFTEKAEPLAYGTELIVGSLIKNPGGAIAETGGYIAGKSSLVERCAHRLTVPGAGRELGCNPAGLRNLYLGLYMAPAVTAEALKSAVYAAALFERLGYAVSPRWDEPRHDIITAIELGSGEKLTALCRAIQSASPIDSALAPEPWDMPGYSEQVIMAAGAFTGGSSIELSCDAPMAPPYRAYLQGGIALASSRYALLSAAEKLK